MVTNDQSRTVEIITEAARTPITKKLLPLAVEVQNFFNGIQSETEYSVEILKGLLDSIKELEDKIRDTLQSEPFSGYDEQFVITWIYNFQTDSFRNWCSKLKKSFQKLEDRMTNLALQADLELANPHVSSEISALNASTFESYLRMKNVYLEIGKHISETLAEFHALKSFINDMVPISGNRYIQLLRPNMVTDPSILNAKDHFRKIQTETIEGMRQSLDRLRELYFRFGEHQFAESAARSASQSNDYLLWTVKFSSAAVLLSIIGILIQLFDTQNVEVHFNEKTLLEINKLAPISSQSGSASLE